MNVRRHQSPCTPPILIVAGAGFLRAYSGTLNLARALRDAGRKVEVRVVCSADEVATYQHLDVPVRPEVWETRIRSLRRLRALWGRCTFFLAMCRAPVVLLTEDRFLVEAALAKRLRGRRLTLVHYCQELALAEEYPDFPRIRLLNRLAAIPDITVDVEPNRARARQERLRLRQPPLVLRNTLPLGGLPVRSPPGTLRELAGVAFPAGVPILIHMGGIGREKPLRRVIDAVACCGERVFFLAFCDGPAAEIEQLKAYAEERLVPGMFRIRGACERSCLLAAAWEADAGIVDYSSSVDPSTNQRFCAPSKFYEFMALGLAVVASENDALREIIVGEGIGASARDGSIQALGQAIREVLGDRDELLRMRERARAAFSVRHCYEQTCFPVVRELLERIAARSPPDPAGGRPADAVPVTHRPSSR
jgi:glycosyltransferase involved in cell wall biosynthesis